MTTSKIFKKLHIKDREKLMSLVEASPTAACVWLYLYLCTDKDDCCTESRPEIEKATMMSHNTVDKAMKLLRDQQWLVPMGYVPIEDGKWVVKHRVQVGFTIPKNWVEPQTPKNGDSSIPKKRGATVDHHVPVSVDRVESDAKPILGVEGGVPPRRAERGRVSIAELSADTQDDGVVDAPSALQRAAAGATSLPSSAIASQSKTNPNPTGLRPVPHEGAAPPATPACRDTGVSESESKKLVPMPSWKQPLPEPQSDAERLAVILYRYLQGRLSLGHKIEIYRPWLKFWSKDFQAMIDDSLQCGWDTSDIEMVIWYSQFPKNQEYYIRAAGILSNFRDLHKRCERKQASFRVHQCKHKDCVCWFSNVLDYIEHLKLNHAKAAPPPELRDQIEEEMWMEAEDVCALGIGINEAEPEYDPFADSRYDILGWEEVTGLPEGDPGRQWVSVKVPEDWGQWDLSYEMPEPLPHIKSRSVRPDGETELPEPLRRIEERIAADRRELGIGN